MNKKRNLASVVLSVLMVLSILCGSMMPAMAATETDTSDYEAFVANLEVLEDYAHSYVQEKTTENEIQIVINYIRTGVAKYTTGTWTILAGEENTAFTQYVAEKDAENSTTASALKNIDDEYTIANGNIIDLRHMFGSMDVAYYSSAQGASQKLVQSRLDLSSWAGDVCDLMLISNRNNVTGTVEEMAEIIKDNYLGENYDYAFGQDDIYGDLDSFYILRKQEETGERISTIMEQYFTVDLTDKDRVDFFLNNRLDGVRSKNDIRTLLYRDYTRNQLLYSLETSRSLQTKHDLRTACIYAFADYLFEIGGDPNAEDTVGEEKEELADNEYYSVFSSTSTNLAPGIKQDIKYAITKDNKQIVYYLATVDINRDDVNIYANYNNNDPTKWAMSRTTDQMAAIQAKHTNQDDTENYIENYNTILGTNGDFYNMGNGKPTGTLVMNGIQYCAHNYRADRGFFAILKDGTPVIGSGTDWDAISDDVQEAIGGSLVIIKNGELVNQTTVSNYYGTRAPRTSIGITSEGKLIMMVLDGRQEPFSAGGDLAEVAQIMLDAGCVEAINLDGGGSSTFAAKQEGADEVTVVNRPSDGYERSVSSSLVVVSTAEPSNKFDHVLVESETDYLTVGSSVSLNLNGVSTTGNSAEVPEDATYQISDESIGYIENGRFYANSEGDVEITVVSNGENIGSKVLHVVKPDRIYFTKSSMDVIYGKTITLPICASYNGNEVTINSGDIFFQLSNNNAGKFNGFDFTAAEDTGINNITIMALLNVDFGIKAQIAISIYDENAAIFDFENAMAGDRMLAWNRYVSNSTTNNNKVYYIEKEGEPMTAEYTFGIDMRSIPIPSQLTDLLYMVAGGDIEGISAWNFLLQLAERVSPLTHVSVEMDFHQDVDVDISELTVVSDYFILNDKNYDPVKNKLTLEVSWIKQSAAIPEDTANPICIVSGIKITPRDDAYWEDDTDLIVPITGKLHYWIGLRSSQLYTMSLNPEFQQNFGIYDYDNSANLANDKGGCFELDYLDFDDSYQLNKEIKQGWTDFYGNLYYFVDNEPLTGIQKLPGIDDPEKEYYYDLGEDGVCKGKVNGLFELDGDIYYALNGTLQVSWYPDVDENGETHYYYFDRKTYKAVDGKQTINGYDYEFENRKLVRGSWVETEYGKQYMWAGSVKNNQWFEVDGKEYFALPGSKHKVVATGIASTLTHDRVDTIRHIFDEDGVWQGDLTGPFDYNGETYLADHGILVIYPGLVKIGNDYYYFKSNNAMVKNQDYYLSKTNGLLAAGKYTFDENGKLELLDGIVKVNDTTWYYYENGVKVYAGLIEIDGDIYYVRTNCEVVHGKSYYVSKTNGLRPEGTYQFDADGKLIEDKVDPDEPHIVLNGIVKETEDTWYYYVDDVKTYAGLVEIDGDLYYAKTNCTVIHNQSYYISKTNGLLPKGWYNFDKDGKLIVVKPEDMKNGIVKETEDTWYYYINDIKTYAGIIKIDGDYYYVKTNGEVVHGQRYYITKTNGIMPQDWYTFDADGKLYVEPPHVPLNGIVKETEDTWYYYVNDKKTYAGLIKIDGDYYYVNSAFEVIHGKDYFISKNNNLMPQGTYTFDADGKLVILDGIVKDGDTWYYYVNDKKTYAGLIEIDGDYYYVNSSFQVIHGRKYFVSKTNGLVKNGDYLFDADGKMVRE